MKHQSFLGFLALFLISRGAGLFVPGTDGEGVGTGEGGKVVLLHLLYAGESGEMLFVLGESGLGVVDLKYFFCSVVCLFFGSGYIFIEELYIFGGAYFFGCFFVGWPCFLFGFHC